MECVRTWLLAIQLLVLRAAPEDLSTILQQDLACGLLAFWVALRCAPVQKKPCLRVQLR